MNLKGPDGPNGQIGLCYGLSDVSCRMSVFLSDCMHEVYASHVSFAPHRLARLTAVSPALWPLCESILVEALHRWHASQSRLEVPTCPSRHIGATHRSKSQATTARHRPSQHISTNHNGRQHSRSLPSHPSCLMMHFKLVTPHPALTRPGRSSQTPRLSPYPSSPRSRPRC